MSDWIAADLAKSGLSMDDAKAAGIKIIKGNKDYKEILGYSRFDGNPLWPTIKGYVIPYPHAYGENGTGFHRVKLNTELGGAKYLSPKSSFVKYPSHLYIHQSQKHALKTAKKPLVIVEGEKKAIATLNALGTDYCVIGISGITQWMNVPEWKGLDIKLKGRDIYVCMDADGVINPDVRREELKMYAKLLNAGANPKSLIWDVKDGKGIDDLLVNKGLECIFCLINEAISPVEKFKDRPATEVLTTLKKIPLNSSCAEMLAIELKNVYKITKSTVLKSLQVTSQTMLTTLPTWANDWVYLYYHNKFFSLKTKEMISERAFNLLMNQHTDDRNIGEILTASGLMPIYSNAIYLPGAAEEFEFEGKSCVNLFKMWPPANGEMNPEVIETVLEHAKRRFPEDWKLLIDFLAWCVQNPGKKLAWVMFIQGVQGDGKTYWSRMMTTVMGAANTKEIDPVAVKSNFTGWAEGCVFAVMEEIRLAGQNRYEIMDRTKSIFTNPRISIHRKGLDPYDAPNVTNYLLLTNHQDALPLHHDDRRYCILFSSCQYKDQLEDKKYFDKLYSTLDERNSLLLWLENWKISSNFSQFQASLDTESRDEMIEINKSELRLLLEDYLGNLPTYQELIYNKDIAEWLRLGGYRFAPTSIGKEMVNMGFERKRDSDKRAYIRRLPF